MCHTQAETGFRTSAGISCSKMLAKLVSGMHKPDDQTVMLPCHAAAFVATLPVRAIPGLPCLTQEYYYMTILLHLWFPASCICHPSCAHLTVIVDSCFVLHLMDDQYELTCCPPGIGWKMDKELTALGVTSANDLRSVPLANLTKVFGERTAKYMYSACRGEVCLHKTCAKVEHPDACLSSWLVAPR